MLSMTKIHSQSSQAKGRSAAGYLHYLGKPAPRERGFEAYALGSGEGPAPFWACQGPALLGLGSSAETEQVERLARGFHPITGAPLVRGAGAEHVMGLDMTFSAPKDVSAIYAGADTATREAVLGCLRKSTEAALAYVESAAVSRHGAGGLAKQFARAAIAACFTHYTSRAGQPQLHIHSLLFNVVRRSGSEEWSAMEQRGLFDRKLATGILWRAELASRLSALGFEIEPDGPYFTIGGISEGQRAALSDRCREIDEHLAAAGMNGQRDGGARNAAALATRSAKAELSHTEMLRSFTEMAGELGITPQAVAAMRSERAPEPPLAIDHEALLEELTAAQSCTTTHEALAAICEKAMGRWNAADCLAELDRFMTSPSVVQLGRTEQLAQVFTSKATKDLEERISRGVIAGAQRGSRLDRQLVDAEFDRLESEMGAALGVSVSFSQQRQAAIHAACDTGAHAFIEGWAGSGKTTLLRASARAWAAAGFEVRGCCQSAAAAQNLLREAGIPSRTVASLLISLRNGRQQLTRGTVLVLDEAGMLGSKEFGLLQEAVISAGAKLVCVGDSKQLQPIEAGGIFASLARLHGKAELSDIRRQRTDFEPLLAWLEARSTPGGPLTVEKASALRALPEDTRVAALEAVCAPDPKLARAFARWRDRFDFEWMREAVELLATGQASAALALLDERGRLKLADGRAQACDELISAWSRDKAPLPRKAIIAATRADAAELNAMARQTLVDAGALHDELGVGVEIRRRDGSSDIRRFAPNDRIAFLANDRALGVANGVSGTVERIEPLAEGPLLVVHLDAANPSGDRIVRVPASFAMFDWAYATTNHRAQGRTFDTAHVLANPSMCDREWAYVAVSRSRFATTIYADALSLAPPAQDSHAQGALAKATRAELIDALASRMRRSRAKGTSLDFDAQGPQASADIRPKRPTRRVEAELISAARSASKRIAQRLAKALRPGREKRPRLREDARQLER